MLSPLIRFLKKRISYSFLLQLIIGIIILVSNVTASCALSNKIMRFTMPGMENERTVKFVFILLHLMIIVYFTMITRFLVQRVLNDIPLVQTILSLIGPTIGGASLFYSPFLKALVS